MLAKSTEFLFLPLLFPLFQSTLSGPRSVVLDRVSVAAEGAVSCEATASSSSAAPPSFQTERGSIDLTVVSLPAKTPPGLFGILAFCLFCTWSGLAFLDQNCFMLLRSTTELSGQDDTENMILVDYLRHFTLAIALGIIIRRIDEILTLSSEAR